MRFYRSLHALDLHPPSYSDPFIVQWVIPDPVDERERMFIVFNGVEEYMRHYMKGRYRTCHELFTSINGNALMGHPSFDIDMTGTPPPSWQEDLIWDIKMAIETVAPSVPIPDLVPVWMTSKNPSKLSKHLTIRNVALTSWRLQMKAIVRVLKSSPTRSHPMVIEAIDDGIYRTNGSLRLPLNGKPSDGKIVSPLVMDDPTHSFLDGLVLIYEANLHTMKGATIIGPSDMRDEYRPVKESHLDDDDVEYDGSIVTEAFKFIDKIWGTGLTIGHVGGRFVPLKRERPGRCPISRVTHDSDNAYILIRNDGSIMFGCHRGCKLKGKKLININTHNDGVDRVLMPIILARLKQLERM